MNRNRHQLQQLAQAMLRTTDPTLEQENAAEVVAEAMDEASQYGPPGASYLAQQLEEVDADEIATLCRLFL